jgi:hypothetical protein
MSLIRSVEASLTYYWGSKEEMINERLELFSSWHALGQPTVFGTLSMYDTGSLPLFRMSVSRTDADALPPDLYNLNNLPSSKVMLAEISKNPVAAARHYLLIVEEVLARGFLGYDLQAGRPLVGGGALGVVRHVYLVTETQESGTLHTHFLVWVVGAASTFGAVQEWVAKEGERRARFEAALAAYADSVITTHLPAMIACENPTNGGVQCPRCGLRNDVELEEWRDLAVNDELRIRRSPTRPAPAIATCPECETVFDHETVVRESIDELISCYLPAELNLGTTLGSREYLRLLMGGERLVEDVSLSMASWAEKMMPSEQVRW